MKKAFHVGEKIEHFGGIPAAWSRTRRAARRLEVFGDGQAAEKAAVLGHEAQAGAAGFERLAAANLGAVETDAAGAPLHQSHDARERGGLAGAVASKQRYHFSARNIEGQTEKDPAIAVRAIQSADFEQRHASVNRSPRTFMMSSQLRAIGSVL